MEGRPQYTEAERMALVEKICELYETDNVTIDSCCDAAGVNPRTFRNWVNNFSEVSDRYAKAKEHQTKIYFERLRTKALTSLERLIDGEDYEEVKTEKDVTADGEEFVTKRTRITKRVMPHPTVTIFAVKGEFPDKYADRNKTELSGGVNVSNDAWFTALPLEKRLQILEIANMPKDDAKP